MRWGLLLAAIGLYLYTPFYFNFFNLFSIDCLFCFLLFSLPLHYFLLFIYSCLVRGMQKHAIFLSQRHIQEGLNEINQKERFIG